jgi:hypothetical protein
MNRITVCTCAWKRPEVFHKFLTAWSSLNPVPHIVVAGSAGDLCEAVAELFPNVDYFRTENKPVGKKWNMAHKRAAGTADYYLTTGSDDVMDQAMWDYYQSFAGTRLALLDLYFYDLTTRRTLYWVGYPDNHDRHGMPIGAHQLSSQEVMDALNFEPFNEKTMAHEFDTERKIQELGIRSTFVTMKETGGIGVDIKSPESYSRFTQWRGSHFVDSKLLPMKSPDLMKIITA